MDKLEKKLKKDGIYFEKVELQNKKSGIFIKASDFDLIRKYLNKRRKDIHWEYRGYYEWVLCMQFEGARF